MLGLYLVVVSTIDVRTGYVSSPDTKSRGAIAPGTESVGSKIYENYTLQNIGKYYFVENTYAKA